MFTKVKRQLFNRGRKGEPPVIRSVAKGPNNAPLNGVERDYEIEILVSTLRANVHAFGPLGPAVGGVLKSLEIFEVETTYGHKHLWVELKDLFGSLLEYFRETEGESTSHGIIYLARCIERETEPIPQMGERAIAEYGLNENIKLWDISDEQAVDNLLRQMPHSPGATYGSKDSSTPYLEGCTPGTRVDILNDLRDWARLDKGPNFCWLDGMVGTGKTAILYSLRQYLEDDGRFTANFFCSRRMPTCNYVRRIMPTISHQLCRVSRPFRSVVFRTIEQDAQIWEQPLAHQFDKLIAAPLRKVGHTFMSTPVVLIDGIDGCGDRGGVEQLLDALLAQ
ncbi:hypothetical protein FRC07_013118, partial [Ceratobasidium sp. 392]